MTIAEIITEHLGSEWWRREHEVAALCVLCDRVREELGDDADVYYLIVRTTKDDAMKCAGDPIVMLAFFVMNFMEQLRDALTAAGAL